MRRISRFAAGAAATAVELGTYSAGALLGVLGGMVMLALHMAGVLVIGAAGVGLAWIVIKTAARVVFDLDLTWGDS